MPPSQSQGGWTVTWSSSTAASNLPAERTSPATWCPGTIRSWRRERPSAGAPRGGRPMLNGGWLAVSVSTLLIGLVMLWLIGRGATRLEDTGRTAIGPSIGWGLLAFFGLPILAVLALVTIVGIPLGLGVLAALALIYTLGYTATGWLVGRRILRGRTAWVVAFLLGWGILRALALIPIVGGLIWFVAVVVGLGALTVTIWRARSTGRAAPAAA